MKTTPHPDCDIDRPHFQHGMETWGHPGQYCPGLNADHDPETQVLMALRWRTGRRNGRVLYAIVDDTTAEPSDDDIMIGSVDAPEIAHLIVLNHNRAMHHTPAES